MNEDEARIIKMEEEIERLRAAMTGWDAYGWKNGHYVDSMEDFFEDVLNGGDGRAYVSYEDPPMKHRGE